MRWILMGLTILGSAIPCRAADFAPPASTAPTSIAPTATAATGTAAPATKAAATTGTDGHRSRLAAPAAGSETVKATGAAPRNSKPADRPKVEFQNASVRQVLDYVAEVGKFSIVYDRALADAGIDLGAVPVSIRVSGIAYDDLLMLVLPRECGYRVEAGYIVITTLEKSWLPLPIRSYDLRMALADIPDYGAYAPRFQLNNIGGAGKAGGGVGGLFTAPAPAPDPAGRVTPERIIELIKMFVTPESDRRIAPWSDTGGPATITYLNGYVIVTQTPLGHAAVLRIITMIE
jgi:hypothetical protein